MDVNQVRFGNYTIANSQAQLTKKEDAKKENVKQETSNPSIESKVSAEDIYNAMDITAAQNKAQISVAKKEVNPLEHLSQDRINDIEAMMAEFENGVNKTADIIEQEFPGLFPNDARLALASKVFAQES